MEKKVDIGKYTLESLTTGMYEQPLIVYREYIQNAVDSIDEAIRQNILASLGARIDIKINEIDSSIIITDNGAGISFENAPKVLLSVGASTKKHNLSRGFRGIGRLGGLSYCGKLIFETSMIGELKATRVIFDCDKLKHLLLPGTNDGLSMEEVIESVSDISRYDCEADEHFFIVRMENVDEDSGLLNYVEVYDYLSQTAPVAFDPRFYFSKKIKEYLKEKEIEITEFPIFLASANDKYKPIYKANKRHYTSGRGNDPVDIYNIKFFDVLNYDQLIAVGWYAENDWFGTIHEDTIRGLRLRKGNIQIGDDRTLDKIFKQSRFNGWTQGDIYVLSNDLIPNARRDNFEQNKAYHDLIAALTRGIGAEISALISEASRIRNNPNKKIIDAGEKLVVQGENLLKNGFNSKIEKERTKEEIEKVIEAINTISNRSNSLDESKKKTINQLQTVLDKVENEAKYKYDSLNGIVSRKENKLIRTISDILTIYLDRMLLDQIIDEIIEALKKTDKDDG